jgi:hypothetical protein
MSIAGVHLKPVRYVSSHYPMPKVADPPWEGHRFKTDPESAEEKAAKNTALAAKPDAPAPQRAPIFTVEWIAANLEDAALALNSSFYELVDAEKRLVRSHG